MNYFKVSKFFLVLPVLGIVIVTTSTLFPFIVGKYVWFRSTVALALIFFCLGLLFDKIKGKEMWDRISGIFKRPIVIAVTVFVAVFLLAGFFGINPANSFWSNFERGEGGLQLLNLWMFFMLLVTLFKEKKDWEGILNWALVGGILMSVYGFFAAFGAEGFIGAKFSEFGSDFRFQGSIGNPAYVATYAIFMMFYSAYLLVTKYKNKILSSFGGILTSILTLFFFAVFILAATRGGFIGLGASILAMLLYVGFKHKKWRKKALIAVIAIIIIAFSFVVFRNTPFIKSIPGSRIFDISYTAQTFQHRVIMWKVAWDGFKERPLLGWGPENFLRVFDEKFNTDYFKPNEGFGAWFDRAHNIYFDYLVSAGILGLLSFLSIFIIFYISFFRHSKRTEVVKKDEHTNYHKLIENGLLFGLFFAYLVQGIVLFDVSPIYLNIFLILALSVWKFGQGNKITEKTK